MEANLIKSYFKKVPAVICTAGSYIALKNCEARDSLPFLSVGELLFEHMSPENVLKYEAHFASCHRGGAFYFPISFEEHSLLAVANFGSIYSRRFAEVLLFEDSTAMEKAHFSESDEPSSEEAQAFATALLDICDDTFEPLDKRGLIDLRSTTAALLKRAGELGISALLSNDAGGACLPADVPMACYQQMLLLMMMAIGKECPIRVFLSKAGEGYCVLVEAQNEREIRADDSCISLCRYIAGLCDCTLSVKHDEDSPLSLALTVGEGREADVDFKSRDHLLYFDESFEFSRKYLSALSADAQKQGEDENCLDSCFAVL